MCLLNSVLFGLASVFLCHAANPPIAARLSGLFAAGAGVPLALALGVLYGADIAISVRSAIRIGDRLAKLQAIHRELAEKLDALKAEQQRAAEAQRQRLEEAVSAARQSAGERAALARQSVQARLEPLADLGDEFALRLEEAKNEAQQKLHALYQRQDFFERRLLRSFPALRSLRHGEALARWREYLARRKK